MVGMSYLCEGGHFSVFPTAIVKIFGITNGGFITTLAFFAVPVSSIMSFVCVQLDFHFHTILIIASILTFINLCILIKFDDSEMVRSKERSLSASVDQTKLQSLMIEDKETNLPDTSLKRQRPPSLNYD